MKTIKTAEDFFKDYFGAKEVNHMRISVEDAIKLCEAYHSQFSQPLTDGEVEKLADISQSEMYAQEHPIINAARKQGFVKGFTHPLRSKVEVVCDCSEDKFCCRCHEQKGWIIKDGKFVKQINKVEVVSDEEMEKQFPINRENEMLYSYDNEKRQEGAKWMRDKLQPK